MKPLLFTLVSLLFCLTMDAQDCSEASLDSIADPGPYTVASMIESDGLRNGPDYFGATVYYPTNAQPPYASIALVPGFFSEESTVAEWGPFFASHGIVCMTIGTNTYSQFPGARAEALVDAVQTLRAENERVASPLHMAMDTSRFAVGGWSMGGGGAQLATSLDPSLKASLALCPWLLGPTSSDLNHDVPVLIFSGQNDPTAPPSAHASVHYQLTPSSTNKLLFEVENGDHSVANGPTGANGDVGKAALSWLRTYLLDEPCYCPLIEDSPITASIYLSDFDCPAILPSCPEDINGDGIVDILDFIALNSEFGNSCTSCAEDINGDGLVDIGDFLALNSNLGTTCN